MQSDEEQDTALKLLSSALSTSSFTRMASGSLINISPASIEVVAVIIVVCGIPLSSNNADAYGPPCLEFPVAQTLQPKPSTLMQPWHVAGLPLHCAVMIGVRRKKSFFDPIWNQQKRITERTTKLLIKPSKRSLGSGTISKMSVAF